MFLVGKFARFVSRGQQKKLFRHDLYTFLLERKEDSSLVPFRSSVTLTTGARNREILWCWHLALISTKDIKCLFNVSKIKWVRSTKSWKFEFLWLCVKFKLKLLSYSNLPTVMTDPLIRILMNPFIEIFRMGSHQQGFWMSPWCFSREKQTLIGANFNLKKNEQSFECFQQTTAGKAKEVLLKAIFFKKLKQNTLINNSFY